jgi:hypothetical protein
MSETSFEAWAREREMSNFKSWKIELQANLRHESTDSMTEEELHSRMEEDRENDDHRYFDEKEY